MKPASGQISIFTGAVDKRRTAEAGRIVQHGWDRRSVVLSF